MLKSESWCVSCNTVCQRLNDYTCTSNQHQHSVYQRTEINMHLMHWKKNMVDLAMLWKQATSPTRFLFLLDLILFVPLPVNNFSVMLG